MTAGTPYRPDSQSSSTSPHTSQRPLFLAHRLRHRGLLAVEACQTRSLTSRPSDPRHDLDYAPKPARRRSVPVGARGLVRSSTMPSSTGQFDLRSSPCSGGAESSRRPGAIAHFAAPDRPLRPGCTSQEKKEKAFERPQPVCPLGRMDPRATIADAGERVEVLSPRTRPSSDCLRHLRHPLPASRDVGSSSPTTRCGSVRYAC